MWCTGTLECRMCGHQQVSVWPAEVLDEDAMECSNCGHMTCEPVENIIEGPSFDGSGNIEIHGADWHEPGGELRD